MTWRQEFNVNGLSLARCQANPAWLAKWIKKIQHQQHAFGKPYIRGFSA